jgi:cytochrome c5
MSANALTLIILSHLALAGQPADPPVSNGKAVYEERCRLCHEVGLQGAPQPGNRRVWPKPTEQNIEALARRAECGHRVMPPMGTCKTCTIDDIKAAIRYMIEYKP